VLQNVYISLPYITAASAAVIDRNEELRHCQSMYNHAPVVGCVAQWLERWSVTGELSLSNTQSAADG